MLRRSRSARPAICLSLVAGVLAVVCAPAPATGSTAVVVNDTSNSVSLIDTATNTSFATVAVGQLPLGVAVTPDGALAYVVDLGTSTASSAVTPVRLGATPSAQPSIGFSSNPPNFIAISPDGRKAYVTDPTNGKVVPLDLTTTPAAKGAAVPAGTHPEGIAFAPGGATAYATDNGGTSITPIDVATNAPGAAIPVRHQTFAIAVTPDGKTAYVTSLGDNTVTPVDLASGTALADIHVGAHPQGIAITPDGRTAYVADGGDGTVTPIDTATNGTSTPINVGGSPYGIAVTPDGSTVYVTDGNGSSVTPITVATAAVGSAIPVGGDPRAIAIAKTATAGPPAPKPTGSATQPAIFSTVTLPSAKRCLSKRELVIHVGLGRAAKLHFKLLLIFVGGHLRKSLSGSHLRSTIDLRGLPKGTFTVTIDGVTTAGKHLTGKRRYHTCAKKRRHRPHGL